MRRRRWPWLLAAAVLLGASAFLMSRDDPERPTPAWQRVQMPRAMKKDERARAEQRRTLAAPAASPEVPNKPATPIRPRDPLLTALPSKMERGVMVVEANAIRHSPVGNLLIECLTSRDGGRRLERLRNEVGIDPLEDLDRVAMADDTLMLSGHFEKAKWGQLFADAGTQVYGQKGTLYQPTRQDGDAPGFTVGVWDGQMVVLGDTPQDVQATLDRLEGRGLHGEPVLDESQTYGEIYGVLTAAALADMLPQDQQGLAEQLRDAAERIELHVDTTRDVGVVANVTGPDGAKAQDLGKTVGAALSLGRLQAQAQGNTSLAELMDLARIVPGDGDFRLEVGLPLEVIEKHLQRCIDRNRERARDEPPAP